jgi:hypothetical protein
MSPVRSLAFPAAVMAGVLLLTGCGGNEPDGGRPVPVDPGGDSATTSGTPATSPTAVSTTAPSPSQPTSTTTASRKAQVVVVPGSYRSNPAVQGLVKTYPLYFQALVARDSSIIKKSFPAFFYADVGLGIEEAKANGLVMKPPGSVVVVGIQPQKEFGIIRVKTCRSQNTQYWNPKAKAWDVVAPKGTPQAIDMIQTGVGWMPYRLGPSQGISCARVRYPA